MTDNVEYVHDKTEILAHLFFASGTADPIAVSSPLGRFQGTVSTPVGDQVLIAHPGVARALRAGLPLRVEHVGPDDAYAFDTEVLAAGQHVLKVALPRLLERKERRAAPRAALSASAGVAVVLVGSPAAPRCAVRDLSPGGVGFAPPTGAGPFEVGQVLDARLELPGNPPIFAQIEVRHAREDAPGSLVGARFAMIAVDDRLRLIEALLALHA